MICWSCGRENLSTVRFCSRCGAGLVCLECGAPTAAGRRFCTQCGHRFPVRGAQSSVVRIARHVQETPHFRIHYASGSFAETQIGSVAGRLETAYAEIAGTLGAGARPAERIDVYLSELLEDTDGSATAGYAVPERGEIHEVYRSDAPGLTLERSVLQLLLTGALGTAVTPAFAVAGLLGWLVARGDPDSRARGAAMLTEMRVANVLPSVAEIVAGPAPEFAQYYGPLATMLTIELIDRFGMARYLDFVGRLPAGADAAAQGAFGVSLKRLEKDRLKAIKTPGSAGVLQFFRMSLPYLRPHLGQVSEILFYIGVGVAFTVLFPLSQKWLIDRAILPGDRTELFRILAGITALFVVASLMGLRSEYVSAQVAEKVLLAMRLRIFSLLQRLEPAFFQRVGTGDIMSRVSSDLLVVQFALTSAMESSLRLVLTLVVSLITVFWLDWKLGLLALTAMPLFVLTTRFLGPPAAAASLRRQQDLAATADALQENLAAQPVVKAFGLEQQQVTGYRAGLQALFRSSTRLGFLSSVYGFTANSLASGIQLIVLGAGGYLIVEGQMTLGALIAFLALLGQLIGPVQGLSGIMQSLQQATGAMKRVDELLTQQPTIADAPAAQALPPVARAIRLEDVTLSYTGQQPNLDKLSLEIPAGARVALVGPSGCGKSTVLNAIMRFYDPDDGHVTFDGVDLRAATLASVRGQMGVVFQDNFLFNTSIRENIRMGRQDATDEDVEAAARAAEIHDLILSMPQGYDTVVGERGGRLSGGQRQRVAIARAIVRNPSVLILDEATSALDPHTEAAINATLSTLSEGRTTIAVTHRLTAAAQMDRIIVLESGRLAEQGTHDELLRHDGLYARLWKEQTGHLSGAFSLAGLELESLMAVPLFAGLDDDILESLVNRMGIERYASGDVIVNQGERGDRMYVVHRGRVEVVYLDDFGSERSLAELHEGQYFGEVALLEDAPRMATVRAVAPVILYTLSRRDLDQLCAAAPDVREALERTVQERTLALAAS